MKEKGKKKKKRIVWIRNFYLRWGLGVGLEMGSSDGACS